MFNTLEELDHSSLVPALSSTNVTNDMLRLRWCAETKYLFSFLINPAANLKEGNKNVQEDGVDHIIHMLMESKWKWKERA